MKERSQEEKEVWFQCLLFISTEGEAEKREQGKRLQVILQEWLEGVSDAAD